MNVPARVDNIDRAQAFLQPLRAAMADTIVGQHALIDRLLIGLLTQGHVLLEGLPGLAKTLTVKTLASALDLSFQRIQFTPDLLPADITGTLIYSPKETDFIVHKGPIFANVVLADEINRAPAKVQSALLEAMQERKVTIGRTTFTLTEPFIVLATQNPIEHEGTYPLPEAQLDRFLLHLKVDYPTAADERTIVEHGLARPRQKSGPVVSWSAIAAAREALYDVYLDPKISSYILDLIRATRDPASIKHGPAAGAVQFGASPRAAVHLSLAARAQAFLCGRHYVLPDDVREVVYDVLRHRLILTYEAEINGVSADTVLKAILAAVRVP